MKKRATFTLALAIALAGFPAFSQTPSTGIVYIFGEDDSTTSATGAWHVDRSSAQYSDDGTDGSHRAVVTIRGASGGSDGYQGRYHRVHVEVECSAPTEDDLLSGELPAEDGDSSYPIIQITRYGAGEPKDFDADPQNRWVFIDCPTSGWRGWCNTRSWQQASDGGIQARDSDTAASFTRWFRENYATAGRKFRIRQNLDVGETGGVAYEYFDFHGGALPSGVARLPDVIDVFNGALTACGLNYSIY